MEMPSSHNPRSGSENSNMWCQECLVRPKHASDSPRSPTLESGNRRDLSEINHRIDLYKVRGCLESNPQSAWEPLEHKEEASLAEAVFRFQVRVCVRNVWLWGPSDVSCNERLHWRAILGSVWGLKRLLSCGADRRRGRTFLIDR
jgi:hypothetical protein